MVSDFSSFKPSFLLGGMLIFFQAPVAWSWIEIDSMKRMMSAAADRGSCKEDGKGSQQRMMPAASDNGSQPYSCPLGD